MRSYRRPMQFMYAFLVILTVWLINPVLAGSGDPEAAKQAWPMIEQGALLIDVRTAKEFAQGHVDGALNIPYQETDKLMSAIGTDKTRPVVVYCRSGNIPYQETDKLMSAIGTDKTRPVVVYCRSGNRSGKSKVVLETKGYTNIFNATGYEALKETKP